MNSELSEQDVVQLTRLVTEFAWLVDHHKSDRVYELFGGNAELTLGGETIRGVESIAAWGKARTKVDYVTRHVCTNMRFVADGEDRAEGSTVLTIYLHHGSDVGPPDPMAVGEYHDRFVRIAGVWRLESRTVDQIFRGSDSGKRG